MSLWENKITSPFTKTSAKESTFSTTINTKKKTNSPAMKLISSKKSTTSNISVVALYNKKNNDPKETDMCPEGWFPLTKLAPLRSKAGTKKKWVELYCKGLKEVICCFRGHNDAAIALQLDRKIVKKMCEKSDDSIPIFATFALLHAPNKSPPPAYHYGIHDEDYVLGTEDYYSRIQRFGRTWKKDREFWEKGDEKGQQTEVPPTKEIAMALLHPKEDVLLSKEKKEKSINENESVSVFVTIVKDGRDGLISKAKHQTLCVFCQEERADVVVEPCHHAAFCESCLNNFHVGKKFCPICRTSIQKYMKPDQMKYVRPRVFSAFINSSDL